MPDFDALIVGAGAAGLFCAGIAAQRGLRVLLLDHGERIAEKVRISGGGRCNFTNRDLDPRRPEAHFLSDNPRFCRSALSRYTPSDFVALLRRHHIPFHEKHQGQLFCDGSSEDIIGLLLRECETGAMGGSVTRWQPCAVLGLRHGDGGYELDTARGSVRGRALVVASGGLSIPKIGASDFGYRVARQFGLPLVPTRPALVPLTFDAGHWQPFAALAGASLPVRISCGSGKKAGCFDEDLLFTHRGLSGPAVLQISSYWREGAPVMVDLAPGVTLADELLAAKRRSRRKVVNELATWLPQRLAETWAGLGAAQAGAADSVGQRPVNEVSDKALAALGHGLNRWQITPNGSEGYRKAEVTAGGVDTRALSSQTMESRQPGLYFIGEVVDVTGWLGGYNFQWAWASAHACALALPASR